MTFNFFIHYSNTCIHCSCNELMPSMQEKHETINNNKENGIESMIVEGTWNETIERRDEKKETMRSKEKRNGSGKRGRHRKPPQQRDKNKAEKERDWNNNRNSSKEKEKATQERGEKERPLDRNQWHKGGDQWEKEHSKERGKKKRIHWVSIVNLCQQRQRNQSNVPC